MSATSRHVTTATLQALTEASEAVQHAADVVARDSKLDEAHRVTMEAHLRRMAALLVEVPR
jgi:DNA-binding transcriptional regulator/RsmH inhibitor MraZ